MGALFFMVLLVKFTKYKIILEYKKFFQKVKKFFKKYFAKFLIYDIILLSERDRYKLNLKAKQREVIKMKKETFVKALENFINENTREVASLEYKVENGNEYVVINKYEKVCVTANSEMATLRAVVNAKAFK